MTNFREWTQANLIDFAEESQAEIVRLNNLDCQRLTMIADLVKIIDQMCGMFCMQPRRQGAYRAAMKELEK